MGKRFITARFTAMRAAKLAMLRMAASVPFWSWASACCWDSIPTSVMVETMATGPPTSSMEAPPVTSCRRLNHTSCT